MQCLRSRPVIHQARCLSSPGTRRPPANKRIEAIDTERMTTREQRVFDEILQSVLSQDTSGSKQGRQTDSRKSDPAITMAREFIHSYNTGRRSYKKPVEGERAVDRYGEDHMAARTALFACKTSTELQSFIDSTILGPFARQEITLQNIKTTEVAAYCRAYPLLVAEAMTLLRLAHGMHLAVTTLFRRVKALGIVSQAVGIDCQVYNELLLATFEGWRDLDLVESVLAEMQADGIAPNHHTVTLLEHMAQTVRRDREAGEGGELYWRSSVRVRQLEHLNKTIHQYGKRLSFVTTNQARQSRPAELYQ